MVDNKRDEEVSALLHAPLGTLIVIRCIEEMNTSRPCAITAEDFSTFTIQASDDLRFSALSAERLIELVVECVIDFSPYASDYQHWVNALLTCGPFLRHATAQLLDAPGTANWFSDLDKQQQIWIAPDSRSPTQDFFRVNLYPFSHVPKPTLALWTSTRLGNSLGSWIHYLRWGEDRRQSPYHPWRLEVCPTARVYEIHEPEAWHSLCLAFPLYKDDNHIVPDWEKVARMWDGVHLSVGGLLATEQVYRSTPRGRTQLSGWGVESTVWLHWVFTQVERLPNSN